MEWIFHQLAAIDCTSQLAAMSSSQLIHQLQAELRQESFSRRQQEELNSKLQGEYDTLLKRLAEAELHIDRLRLGTTIDINKEHVLSRDPGRSAGIVAFFSVVFSCLFPFFFFSFFFNFVSVFGEFSLTKHNLTS